MGAKVIGFQAYEDIVVSLINVGRCKSCDKLYNFNGPSPGPNQPCPSCKLLPVGGDFPHDQYDPKASPDANVQHILHVLEGYRSCVQGNTSSPYSPGSARDFSWHTGFEQAQKDMAV